MASRPAQYLVEERNLKVQVAALRHALRDSRDGSRYISTVAGRGY
jgi:DNA-binding winged helix-turn-helix (wHTH) protein